MGTSISSNGDGPVYGPYYGPMIPANPHIKFFNNQRGYVRHTVTPDRWQADFQVLDRVSVGDGHVSTRKSFVVEHGLHNVEVVAGDARSAGRHDDLFDFVIARLDKPNEGPEPDGDTIRFVPDKPAHLAALHHRELLGLERPAGPGDRQLGPGHRDVAQPDEQHRDQPYRRVGGHRDQARDHEERRRDPSHPWLH